MYPIVKSMIFTNTSGASPYALLIALMLGGSAAVMSPIGYQTNLMVHSIAGYRFTDWLKLGVPLQLILSFVASALLLWLY